MKLAKSLLLNFLSFCGCAAWGREAAGEIPRGGFELCVLAREPGAGVEVCTWKGSTDEILVQTPAALSSADIRRVTAVTKTSWYVLSGSHGISTIVLRIKPAALAPFQAALSATISRADRMAIILNGEVVGVFMPLQALTGDELVIDAGFFSQGLEAQRAADATALARQIKSTLP